MSTTVLSYICDALALSLSFFDIYPVLYLYACDAVDVTMQDLARLVVLHFSMSANP